MRALPLLVLLAVFASLALAVRGPPAPSLCNALDCISCMKLPGCEWCINQQKCLVNTTQTCAPDCFIPSSPENIGYCPAKLCSLYTDCGSCTSDPECGWCGDNNVCLEASGCPDCLPNSATCRLWKAGGDGNSNCSIAAPCSSHQDCESCNTDPSCGWCGASLTCMLGSNMMACAQCDGCFVQQDIGGCPANHSKCADYTDCYDCVSQPLCGWCPTSLRCQESTDFGPCAGSCAACFVASGDTGSCPAPGKQCTDFTSCAACAEQPGCGWCPETARCTPGTEFGPCSGSCEACWQFGDEAECPAVHTTCANYTDCASCTQQNGCGWCPVNNVCTPGTEFGQCSGSCAACYQFGDGAACPAVHTTCADYKDCASCSQQPGCGWCGATGVCSAGTEFGPCSGSCSSCWQSGSSAECPAPGTACGNYSDCASCTQQDGCGWCPVTEACVAATSYAPCVGQCANCFTTETENCPSSGSCPQFNSQATCSAQPGCMWCKNSNTCVWGNGYEPCLSIQCTTN